MMRPIAISLSPNTEIDDIKLAARLLLDFRSWVKGRKVSELENKFKQLFQTNYALGVSSGRIGEYLILKSLGIKPGDEVLIQALTCVVVLNPILWLGAKPVYVDIVPATYNLDPKDLERKITKRARAVIIQHTFGQPAAIEEIREICQKHKLYLIEDCAHYLGARYKGKPVGTFGDASFFSFGRDKVISSVFGGMVISRSLKLSENFDNPSVLWTIQQLFHPLLFNFLVLPSYNFLGLGKLILLLLQKSGILSRAIYSQERDCQLPSVFLRKMVDAQAMLVLNQLEKLGRFNERRRQIANSYFDSLGNLPLQLPIKDEGAIYLRFTIRTKRKKALFEFAKKKGMLFGDWYNRVVMPEDIDLSRVFYESGSCPEAEKAAREIINLPTYPLMEEEEVRRVISLAWDFFKKDD